MSNLVKTISTRINGEAKRLIKFLRFGRSDIQEKNQVLPYGFDSNPIKDLTALYISTEEIGNDIIVGYINTNQIANEGESRMFSTDSDGNLQIDIHIKNDGTIEFGDNSDNLVRFSELETAFNELRSDFNALVTAYTSHIHITTATVGATAVPGIISPTLATGTISTANMSGSKIVELKTS